MKNCFNAKFDTDDFSCNCDVVRTSFDDNDVVHFASINEGQAAVVFNANYVNPVQGAIRTASN
jgi:hypothetical protein